MDIGWDDLRLFLDVARLGGLSAATGTTRLSAATLGRRVTALEKQIGEPLLRRSETPKLRAALSAPDAMPPPIANRCSPYRDP
ncbi:LysR family transcriptional regulator [Mesorhizobium sp. M0142]|uniref:helix-turn-helix domain-containing protein n=1 Tax=unclassified Mesorhizobium TaxID=325217 RepID=UPI0033358F69